jgi:hypothetical protein
MTSKVSKEYHRAYGETAFKIVAGRKLAKRRSIKDQQYGQ